MKLLETLKTPFEDPDAGRIIRGYVELKKGVKVVGF